MYLKIVVLLFSVVSLSRCEECSEAGFFRSEEDCTAFYRCVDFYGIGKYTKFEFQCPGGLVFDESTSVCNWAWASAPCEEPTIVEEDMTGEEVTTVETETDVVGSGDASNIIVVPSFDYECTEEGLYAHESNCAKFWLCKASGGNLDPAELYRCPEGFLFDESVLRCQKEEDVDCEKVPDNVQERLERPAITLQVSELDSFFRKWSF